MIVCGLVLAAVAGGALTVHVRANAGRWQRLLAPGPLTVAHAFLEDKCTACHTPIHGVEAAKCIGCHANNEALLQRQPTAFHATIGRCAACHAEHQGVSVRPIVMDHHVLARIGLDQLSTSALDTEAYTTADRIRHWLRDQTGDVTRLDATLNCATCHGTKDRHVGLFGADCSQCHGTERWTIAGYRHPSPRSLDCAQCHQAPPSHYMEHFEMVSMKVVGLENVVATQCCGKVQVSQCYRCHQTTSWNDIRGVGYYKHH